MLAAEAEAETPMARLLLLVAPVAAAREEHQA
jgi:hypothetical protein